MGLGEWDLGLGEWDLGLGEWDLGLRGWDLGNRKEKMLRCAAVLQDFTQLEAWKKAMDLAKRIHALTKEFPREEMYGITSQMRRAAVSIAANTAEGFGRYTYADKMHKYVQARGELIELMTFVHYCGRVEYLKNDQERISLLDECTTVHKLLNGLITKMGSLNRPKS